MRSDSFFAIAVLIILGVVVVRFLDARRDQRAERLRLLEKLLADPNLDGETKRAALARLDGGGALYPWIFGVGWLGIFIGTALLLYGTRDSRLPGTMFATIGLGLVSLPLALREVELRRT